MTNQVKPSESLSARDIVRNAQDANELNCLGHDLFIELGKSFMEQEIVSRVLEKHSHHLHDDSQEKTEGLLSGVRRYLEEAFPEKWGDGIRGDPTPFVRRFLYRIYERIPYHLLDDKHSVPHRILPVSIYIPLFQFLCKHNKIRWFCFQQTHFASCFIHWRFSASTIVDYECKDHQRLSTVIFFPPAYMDNGEVIVWLENIEADNKVFSSYRPGSCFDSKAMGGKRINDRVRIIPPSKVNKHAGKDFEHFYEIVLSKYHAYNQIVVGSYQTSDMNLNPITKKRYEGLYYQRVKKALERIKKMLADKDSNRSVLMC